MGIKRIGRHLVAHRWRVRRIFPPDVMAVIERAIKAGEATHSGQVRFVVEGALDGAPLFRDQPARERALDVFSQLRIWDTADNNGVLIYLLLADRDVEIVADRGIDAKVGFAGWEKICKAMETDFRAGNSSGGVIKGIDAVSRLLATHFPRTAAAQRTAGYAGGDVRLLYSSRVDAKRRSDDRLRGDLILPNPGSIRRAPRTDLRLRRRPLADPREPGGDVGVGGIERLADLVAEIEPADTGRCPPA